MAGQCAVCRQPFSKADKFVLVGTEAVHAICVASLQRSVVNRLKKQLAEMAGAFDGSQIEIQRLRQQVTDQARELDRLRRDIGILRAEGERTRELLQGAEHSRRGYQIDFERVARERDQARRERDAARAEAALHQVLSGAREVTEGKKDDRDATVVRFSLLELDDT